MPLDAEAIGRGCTAEITQANQLCGLDLDRFKQALAEGTPITVACTQEEPLFREVAENTSASPAHLRQHPRDRRLVEGCRRGGTKGRSADCRSRRRDAADLAGDARKQRRRADLWPRRDRHRGGAASRRSSGHHRASHQARRRDPAPDQRISRSQGHDPERARTSRAIRTCDRRLRAAVALLARKTRVRAFAQRRHLDLRSDPRSLGRHPAVSRA